MADPQGAMLGNAHGYVDIDVSGVGRNLDLAKQQFGGFIQQTGSMMQSWGQSIAGFGQNLTLWTAPVALAVGTGLNVAADFDSVLTEIQARTGLTAEAMEQVRQTALQLGADTAFSSQQAADAFLNLLTAGLSVEDSLATLPQVLTAAAAGGMDLGTAADLTTSIMASFNLSAQDSTAIIDAMSRASAASPASMNEIGIAMKDVGGLAQMFNLSLDETAAVLAIFAQNGIRGAEAGTQLRSLLLNLSSPTEATAKAWDALGTSLYNADGSMRNLDDVLADIRVGLQRLPVEQQNEVISQLAGSYGIVGFNALLASDGIATMEATMAEQAAAADVAAAMMDTFKMTIDSLMGTVQTFWITVLTPFMNNVLKPLANLTIDVVNAMTAWAAANEPLVQTIMSIVAAVIALGPTLFVVGRGLQLIGFMLTVISSPIALVAAGVAALTYLFRVQLGTAIQFGLQGLSSFQDIFSETGDLVYSVVASVASFVSNFAISLGLPLEKAYALRDGIMNSFLTIRNFISGFVNTARNTLNIFFGLLQNGVPIFTALQTAFGATFGTWDWAQIGADILAGLSAGVSTIGSWVYDNLISPLIGAFNSVDWGAVGTAILQGIGTAISLYSGWIQFVTDNILTPLFDNAKNALSTIDWRQLGEDIIGFIFDPSSSDAGGVDWGAVFGGWMDAIVNFGTSVFDFLGWTFNNVVSPLWQGIANGLSNVDWGQVSTNLMNLFGAALNGLWAGANWAWDNILSPMLDALGNAIMTTDWGQLALNLVGALGNALTTLVAWENWVKSSILDFIIGSAATAIESVDWFGVGQGIINAIGFALQSTFDFVAWLVNSIFNPMVATPGAATEQVDWSGMAMSIFTAIQNAVWAVINFVDWLAETIFLPLATGASQAINDTDWSAIGQGFMDSIADSLPNMAQWVQDWIIGPITAALTGFNPMAGINTTTQVGGGGYQAHLQASVGGAAAGVITKIGQYASGINYVPNDMIALVHQGERIQRANENPYNPNAQTNGMGGGTRILEGGTIQIYANSRKEGQEAAEGFMERFEQIAIERGLR